MQTGLPCTSALERHRGMTALAAPPELTVMHVVLLMAGNALRRKLHFCRRLAMAVGTLQLGVSTKQSKASLFEMIVLPQCPTIGAMATVALFAQSPLMHVVLPVAVDAARLGLTEGLGAMALRATHHIM